MAEVIELEYDAFGRANYYYCNKIVPAGRYVRESDYNALMHDKLAIEGRVNQLVDNYNVLQLKDQNNEAAIAAYIATIEKLQAQRDELEKEIVQIKTQLGFWVGAHDRRREDAVKLQAQRDELLEALREIAHAEKYCLDAQGVAIAAIRRVKEGR